MASCTADMSYSVDTSRSIAFPEREDFAAVETARTDEHETQLRSFRHAIAANIDTHSAWRNEFLLTEICYFGYCLN